MAGETTITIIGNLTADPEPHTTNTGTHVVRRTSSRTVRHCSSAVPHGVTWPTMWSKPSTRA